MRCVAMEDLKVGGTTPASSQIESQVVKSLGLWTINLWLPNYQGWAVDSQTISLRKSSSQSQSSKLKLRSKSIPDCGSGLGSNCKGYSGSEAFLESPLQSSSGANGIDVVAVDVEAVDVEIIGPGSDGIGLEFELSVWRLSSPSADSDSNSFM